MKKCASCGEVKPVTDFHLVSRGMPDRRVYCKPCTSEKRRASYERNGGSDVPYAQLIQREYGITLADYNAQLRRQAHRCAVCRRPETIVSKTTGKPRRLAVDHDHVTGRLRGLLCHRCNILVWAMEDNHTTLHAVAAYIEAFRTSFA
jgi:hypothetical protein